MQVQLSHNGPWLHLWKLDAGLVHTDAYAALKILSDDEVERANKFITVRDSVRYITAHYFLRSVLSRYLGVAPSATRFSKDPYGKPCLEQQLSPPLYFNLSYRDNLFLLGVSNISTMGVDVEKVREVDDIETFSAHYFSVNERAKISAAAARPDQLAMLFTFWAMKEAVLKALAIGITGALPDYDLYAFLETPSAVPGFDPAHAWTIRSLDIAPGYKAAFAVNTGEVAWDITEYAGDQLS